MYKIMHRYERNAVIAPESHWLSGFVMNCKYCLKLLQKTQTTGKQEMCIGQGEFLTKIKSTEA